MASQIFERLKLVSSPEKAKANAWFFKTGPGEYGEGDKFIGVNVPNQRSVAKDLFSDLSIEEVLRCLRSPWHEERLTSLFVMVLKYQKGNDVDKHLIVGKYLENAKYVNNWDLVDSSAPYILGDWLVDRDKSVLYELVESENLWERRISIISTLFFIRQYKYEDTLKLSEQLLIDKHDLIHKAVGWCLREVGKKDEDLLLGFLDRHVQKMPRTTLRYAIERLPEEQRKYYLVLESGN